MRSFQQRPIAFLVAVFLTMAPYAQALALTGAAGLAAHRAIYDIHLRSAQSGSQLINVTGRMMYEWRPACDAWVSNHRFDITYEYADTPPMLISSDFSTFEPFDGKSMNFTSQRRKDGVLFEELRGHAEMNENTKSDDKVIGEANYTIPGDLDFDLPQGALFPTGHTLAVLNALKTNTKFFKATIFDGSDTEGPVDVTSFLGAPVDESEKYKGSKDIDPKLIAGKAWKGRLAFFPIKDPTETPDYEMSLVFHENGVVSDMVIDYKDFSLSQTLVALEPLDNECPVKGNAKKKEIEKPPVGEH